jgi:beta-lactamase regulating signal transducer with metallopeptidase domain
MTIWLAETLIGATLLMLLVLFIRRPVARLWGARFAYALWALPLLRMVLPAIPGWQSFYGAGAQTNAGGAAAPVLVAPADAALAASPALVTMAEAALIGDWPGLLVMLWAVGAAVFLMVQWARHLRFVGRAVGEGRPIIQSGDVQVIVSRHVPGPMAAGIWRRRILLPADFHTRYAPEERRLALLHEAAHHDRRDLVANLAGLVVLAAHWWNPVAHAAWRAFRADQELACDATVLAGTDPETRAAYGQTVLKSACMATPVAACAMNHKHQLKDRIAMMKSRNFGVARRLAGGLFVTATAAAALAATASGQAPAPPAPPAPVAAPAAPAAPHAPAAPQVQKLMVIQRKADAKDGTPATVRVIVNDGTAAGMDMRHLDLPPLDGAMVDGKDGVQVTQTADGRKMIMVRRHVMADAAQKDAGEPRKMAAAEIAAVTADLRTRCEKDGITLPADADIGQLATCGRDTQKEMREAMASARKAVEESRTLSADERAKALKGIEQAMGSMRREVIAILER